MVDVDEVLEERKEDPAGSARTFQMEQAATARDVADQEECKQASPLQVEGHKEFASNVPSALNGDGHGASVEGVAEAPMPDLELGLGSNVKSNVAAGEQAASSFSAASASSSSTSDVSADVLRTLVNKQRGNATSLSNTLLSLTMLLLLLLFLIRRTTRTPGG